MLFEQDHPKYHFNNKHHHKHVVFLEGEKIVNAFMKLTEAYPLPARTGLMTRTDLRGNIHEPVIELYFSLHTVDTWREYLDEVQNLNNIHLDNDAREIWNIINENLVEAIPRSYAGDKIRRLNS